MAVCEGRERRWWTKNEDELLRNWAEVQITTQGAVRNWNDAASLLPGRTNKDCRKRWHKVRQDIRKGAWMPEEDEKLQQAVGQVGLKWSSVSKAVKTRNADQCAKRWQQVLGPDRNHGPWSPEEDKILQDAILKYGNNWKQIGLSELPDRSTHDIRNRSVALNRRTRSSATARKTAAQQRNADEDMASDVDEHASGDTSDDDGTEDPYSDSEVVLGAGVSWSSRSSPGSDGSNRPMETWAVTQQPSTIAASPMDQSLFSNWDMLDPNVLMQQPHNNTEFEIDSMSWFGVPATQGMDMDMDRTYMSPGMVLDESSCLDFNLLDSGEMTQQQQTMGETSTTTQGQEESRSTTTATTQTAASASSSSSTNNNSTVTSASSSNPRTPQSELSRPDSTEPPAYGNVTVVLTRANSHLAQEVIGNLMRMNADLTIRLMKD